MLVFLRGFAPVSASRVKSVEKRLGVTFPEDYRQYLRTTNGGEPEPDCLIVPDGGPTLVGVLYGIGPTRQRLDLEYEQERATLWDPLPPGMLAIAENPGGCRFLLETLGADAGRVLFWDRNGLWVRSDGRNVFPVAVSFSAFVGLIQDRLSAG